MDVFWCHVCNRGTSVYYENELPKCSQCHSDFVEILAQEEPEDEPATLLIPLMLQAMLSRMEERPIAVQDDNVRQMMMQILQMVQRPTNIGDYAMGERGLDNILQMLMEQHQQENRPPPAPEETINQLPKQRLPEALDCSICQEEMPKDHEAMVLPCKHSFHDNCITSWLRLNGTCPVCRLKPLKHYSQNFLLQPQLFTQFVKPHTQVIEIGCGTGNITKQLLKLNPVIGIEIDTRFKPILDSLGFEYHLGSILNPEMSKIVNDKFKEIQMVGNLPFNISGPFCAMMNPGSG
ncbi:hypothetical protein EDD86DRAFT_276808 [Gorgonomyces haynaldii]|nr:hypothetical protein EDD86DRAFT_276808 [Gorgonomyces haynaldii]